MITVIQGLRATSITSGGNIAGTPNAAYDDPKFCKFVISSLDLLNTGSGSFLSRRLPELGVSSAECCFCQCEQNQAVRKLAMTSKSKEKVAAAFRKVFRSSGRLRSPEKVAASSSSKSESPARRLLRHGIHRDQIQPADVPTNNPIEKCKLGGLFKSKKVGSTMSQTINVKETGNGYQQTIRAKRLLKELNYLHRLQMNNAVDPPFTVEPVNDNLFEWHVRLYRIDEESDLAADMRELDIKFILLHVVFPENFPFSPPFMRVISPKIDKGFVMEGGAICMELLTPRGWASAYTVEAVIMQFAASLVKGQGRISKKTSKGFNLRSAEESFRSLVKTHDKYGWVTPSLADG